MSSKRRWVPLVAGAVAVGVISLTTAAVYPAVTQAAGSAASDARMIRGNWGSDGDESAALAEALGIGEEELAAAVESARQAALDQAVAEGRLTQAQADALAERDLGRLGGRGWTHGYTDSLLAEALGITVEELSAARDQVMADRLAQAVADGDLTQAQADRIVARQAFQEYRQGQAQAEMEAAIQAAVEAGALTQAQADLLLSDLAQGFGRGGFGHGFFDRGMMGGEFGGPRGHGGFGGRGHFQDFGFPGGPRGVPGDLPDSGDAQESAPQSNSGPFVPEGTYRF